MVDIQGNGFVLCPEGKKKKLELKQQLMLCVRVISNVISSVIYPVDVTAAMVMIVSQ